MIKRIHETRCGNIHYYINILDKDKVTLVFLPGLTADKQLFEKQIEYFEGKENVFVWDAPAHASSRPFTFDFELSDKATWLNEILEKEEIKNPVIVGQSMGGYVGQMFCQLFPGKLAGFISIDSVPLQKQYMKNWEIAVLKWTEPMYRMYPWKTLLKAGSKGVATTEYGIKLMYDMMAQYECKYYCHLVGHGYKILAKAVEKDLPYEITCPFLIICGEEDKAGYTKKYNVAWHEKTGYPIAWIKDAGHNSNTDAPLEINDLIENFIKN